MTPTTTLALVGPGSMGVPLAARLAASGLGLAVHGMRSQVLTRKFAARMALGLIAKKASNVANIGYSIGALTPLADCVSRTWGKAVVAVSCESDKTEAARLSKESNGVTLLTYKHMA